mmetsp:Transcript_14250/g.36250  ORF Transcript_14250/g.36250 Transcript_14250/m.36250 type:complete len:200 (+) Transcript_14250:130-729(+)
MAYPDRSTAYLAAASERSGCAPSATRPVSSSARRTRVSTACAQPSCALEGARYIATDLAWAQPLPIATLAPHRCSKLISFSPSPRASASSGWSPQRASSAAAAVALQVPCGFTSRHQRSARVSSAPLHSPIAGSTAARSDEAVISSSSYSIRTLAHTEASSSHSSSAASEVTRRSGESPTAASFAMSGWSTSKRASPRT